MKTKETLTERLARTEARVKNLKSWLSDIQGVATRRYVGGTGKKYLTNDLAIIDGICEMALEGE